MVTRSRNINVNRSWAVIATADPPGWVKRAVTPVHPCVVTIYDHHLLLYLPITWGSLRHLQPPSHWTPPGLSVHVLTGVRHGVITITPASPACLTPSTPMYTCEAGGGIETWDVVESLSTLTTRGRYDACCLGVA